MTLSVSEQYWTEQRTTRQRIEAEPTQNSPLTLIPAPDLRKSGSVECCLVQPVRTPASRTRDCPPNTRHAACSLKSPGGRTDRLCSEIHSKTIHIHIYAYR